VHPHLLRPRAQDFRQKRTALRLNLEDTMREVEKYTHTPTSNGSPKQQSNGFRTNVEH
jgi:hypothetical protein